MFMGFLKHFYIIFETNLLTQSPEPSASSCLFPCFSVSKKRNIKRSRNRMKPSGEVILGRKATRETWSPRQESNEDGTRQGDAPSTLVAPLTYFFLLYRPIYPKTFGEQNRSGVPPPQASVATKNQSGPCSGTLPEEGTLTGGHLHHPGALHYEEGVVHPRG